jgi:hypothetical protein
MSEHVMTARALEPAAPSRPNPNLLAARRCGARTRAGCPCQAPAIRGKLRCRMHGGRSTGPRTPEGLARLRAARMVHGNYSAAARAERRFVRTLTTRIRLLCAAVSVQRWLVPEMAARLASGPPELGPPPDPGCWEKPPYTGMAGPDFPRQEAAALAPWRAAIAAAREARREARDGDRGLGAEIEPEPPAPGTTDGAPARSAEIAPGALAPGTAGGAPARAAEIAPGARAPAAAAGAGAGSAEIAPGALAPGTADGAPARSANIAPGAPASDRPADPVAALPDGSSRALNRKQRRRLKWLHRRQRRQARGAAS